MSFVVGILTFILVVNCVLLILLVLVQLPKKDAGAGIAFGGGAADALFGAGSGNVLTKITAWSTGIFIAVILLLSFVHDHLNTGPDVSAFEKNIQKVQQQQQNATMSPAPVPAAPHPAVAATNAFKLSTPTPTTPTAPAPKN